MGNERTRAWRRHQRRRIIARRLAELLARNWREAEWLDERRIGSYANQSPFFCGCTKSRGFCKLHKRREKAARRRARKAIPPVDEW